jgi:cytochrome c oxidase cbb3-type subunit 2
MMKQETVEVNAGYLIILTLIAISIGGLVEIVPLFYVEGTIEEVKTADGKDAVRPYTPLEQLGRDLYTKEGCYTCHSQMIRPFRDEALRFGHYSLAAESQYDHPFQWGSMRRGPDLARVGGKYSNAWQAEHLNNPRDVVPESIMPSYPWLKDDLNYSNIAAKMTTLRKVGVPYSIDDAGYEANVKKFGKEVANSLDINKAEDNILAQARKGNFDGNPQRLTEMDAMVAYLQVLGTMIDFNQYDEQYFIDFR